MSAARMDSKGFALLLTLVMLAVLYAGATGIFLAARAELHAGSNQAVAEQTFHALDGGIASWLAAPVQPSIAEYDIGGAAVRVEARPLVVIDSVTVVYLIRGTARFGGTTGMARAGASREVSLLGVRRGLERVTTVPGTWREMF